MKAFRFSLAQVLHFRRTQLEVERGITQRLMQTRAEVAASSHALAAARSAAEQTIAHAPSLDYQHIQTMSAYQTRTVREAASLMDRQRRLDADIAAQVAKTTEAHRRVRLLERLHDKKLDEWTATMEAENETFAAEAWLARWPLLEAALANPKT